MDQSRLSAYAAVVAAYGIVVADQIAKIFVLRDRTGIQAAHNAGFVTGMAPTSKLVLVAATAIVLALFAGSIGRWAIHIGIPAVIPAVIAGGIAAHGVDRVRFGSVRDFISTGWLIVDVADFAVAGGLVALLIASAWRWRTISRQERTVVIELPRLRAVVVPRDLPSAA
jgi:lipoprotein signal peptidase